MYRISVYIIIKRTLFFINKDFKANITLKKLTFNKFIKKVDVLIKEIKRVYNKLRNNIKFFNICMKKHADNLKIRELTLKKKDKVYLL